MLSTEQALSKLFCMFKSMSPKSNQGGKVIWAEVSNSPI